MSDRNRKEGDFPWTAVIAIVWLTLLFVLWRFATAQDNANCPFITCLTLNEWGDFLAGAFSPLAFFWLARGVYIQSRELTEYRKELEETRKESEKTRALMVLQIEEASKAVKEAAITNHLAAQQLKNQFRAWLEIQAVGPFVRDPKKLSLGDNAARDVPLYCTARVTNIGTMPFQLRHVDIYLLERAGQAKLIGHQPHESGVLVNRLLKAGDSLRVSQASIVDETSQNEHANIGALVVKDDNDFQAFLQDPPPVVVAVRYIDPLGVERIAQQAFQIAPVWSEKWVQYDDPKLVFDREITR